MIIDPSTDVGKLRLRVADYGDIPLLPDSVYVQTLADCDGNLPAAAKTCAMYILGSLAHQTHEKLGAIEYWGAEAYKAYSNFLIMTFTNPSFMPSSPVAYGATDEFNPILEFQKSWNKNYTNGTEAQQLSFNADISPNDGSRLGVYNLRAVG